MSIKRWVIVLSVAALVGAACGGDDSGGNGGSSAAGGGGGGSVQLTASNFAFDPTDLSVAAGGSFQASNEDDTEHNFTADDVGIDQDLDPGDTTTIDLSDVKPGTYDFHCKFHPDTMKGTLEVT